MPVAAVPSLGQVHVGEQLDPRDDVLPDRLRKHRHVVQQSVDSQPDSQAFRHRIKMDVGRIEPERTLEQQIDKGRGTDDVGKFRNLGPQRLLAIVAAL
jgi:hypothetical protein